MSSNIREAQLGLAPTLGDATMRKGVMLAYPLDENEISRWPEPLLVQPKLDGRRCRAKWYGQSYVLLSSQENPIFSCPHIIEALDKLEPDLPDRFEFDGELYSPNLTFEQLSSIVAKSHPVESCELVEFHIFDIVSPLPQLFRIAQLEQIAFFGPLFSVPTIRSKIDELTSYLNSFLSIGYEGIIVRHPAWNYVPKRTKGLMKFKPRKTDTYRIVGFEEEETIHGAPKGSLGALLLIDDSNNLFKVGSGFTRKQREELWLERGTLPGKMCTIAYQDTTSYNIPRFPVFVSIETPVKF